MTHVPAGLKSELPASPNHAIALPLAAESELTPLHMAAYSGSENVVRALLNSSGVQVDAASVPSVRIARMQTDRPTELSFFSLWIQKGHA